MTMFPSLIDRSIWNDLRRWGDNVWDPNRYHYSEPYVDEEGNKLYEVEVPGFNKDNLDVSFENGIVNISGTREPLNGSEVRISERIIISNRDVDNIDAEIKDGILRITVKERSPSVKRIELK